MRFRKGKALSNRLFNIKLAGLILIEYESNFVGGLDG